MGTARIIEDSVLLLTLALLAKARLVFKCITVALSVVYND
jgi:hypothetical protein